MDLVIKCSYNYNLAKKKLLLAEKKNISWADMVCCGVRGRALASHTDVRAFEPQCGGRLPSLICWQL